MAMATSDAIKRAREKRELSQAALAELMGVAPSTVAGWELGTHGVRGNRMRRLANALGVSVGELFDSKAA